MNNYRRYLWVCLALVLCMTLLGGVTRLTGSGLSITEWKLVHGTLPPLNAGQWAEEFAAYQASPEYVKKNFHMDLQDFKGIFWLEYLHRLLGRIIGLVFLSGAIYYAVRRNIAPIFMRRNFLLVGLVAGQGLMGWLMVKSGLIDNPHVSHYRLCAHLLLATLIAAVIYRTILSGEELMATNDCPPLAGGWLMLSYQRKLVSRRKVKLDSSFRWSKKRLDSRFRGNDNPKTYPLILCFINKLVFSNPWHHGTEFATNLLNLMLSV